MFPDHVTRLRDFFFKSDQVTSVINFPQLISNMEEWLDAHFHTHLSPIGLAFLVVQENQLLIFVFRTECQASMFVQLDIPTCAIA